MAVWMRQPAGGCKVLVDLSFHEVCGVLRVVAAGTNYGPGMWLWTFKGYWSERLVEMTVRIHNFAVSR